MAATGVSVPSWREVMGSGRGRLSAGLALTEFVAGMQSLVVVAAMPRVLHDLGGVEFYGTVFSGYFLSGLVSIPLAGRAADREGPTRPFVRMMLCFALGTVLCSLAPSMPLLALARVIQGYGGGAVYTIAYGVIAKAYPSQARPRMLVVLTMTWVVSGLVAPSVGAILATTVGWRWVFVWSCRWCCWPPPWRAPGWSDCAARWTCPASPPPGRCCWPPPRRRGSSPPPTRTGGRSRWPPPPRPGLWSPCSGSCRAAGCAPPPGRPRRWRSTSSSTSGSSPPTD